MTIDTYRLEQAAEERGRDNAAMLQLSGTVGQLSRDVRLVLIILVPVSATALILSIVSFILVLIRL